ncbi:MAG: metallopeptidase TldD-related protein [Eubacteriales bacterium]
MRQEGVERGVLKTLLHNLKTAKKAGTESTGNASRRSAASAVGVSPTVFRVEPGKMGYDELLRELDFLVITELEGLHAGVDEVSGDFSLKAADFSSRTVRGGSPRVQYHKRRGQFCEHDEGRDRGWKRPAIRHAARRLCRLSERAGFPA